MRVSALLLVVTGCYIGFGRASDMWISPITCNIGGWYVYTHVLLSRFVVM